MIKVQSIHRASLEEVREAFPKAIDKMDSYIRRFGNDDGRFDDAYLLQLVAEEVEISHLQAELMFSS